MRGVAPEAAMAECPGGLAPADGGLLGGRLEGFHVALGALGAQDPEYEGLVDPKDLK